MFIVYYRYNDGLFSYERKFTCESESTAQMHVARLKYLGHREAFYRAA